MEQQPLFLTGPSSIFSNHLCSMPRRWTSIINSLLPLLLLTCILLYPERPAWGNDMDIRIEGNKINGYAHHVELGEVLGELARQGGYTVYIDEKLVHIPTSFNIPMNIPAEKAIQRIVHPHSIALVFNRLPEQTAPTISQIRVFNKGNQSASYSILSASGAEASYTSHARSGYLRSGLIPGKGVQAGHGAVAKQVRPPVIITKSAMGFTGFKFKDRRRGPDYRPGAIALAKAYAAYRADRNALHERMQDGQFIGAKQKNNQDKNAYREQRTESIRQTMNNSNN